MPENKRSAEEFYKTWRATHPKLIGKGVIWPGDVSLFEFAEAFAQGEAVRVGELEAGLRAISKQAAWLLGHSFSIPWREGTSQILAEAEKLLRRG